MKICANYDQLCIAVQDYDSEIIKELRAMCDEADYFMVQPFDMLFGGKIHIVESPEDLREVRGTNPNDDGTAYISILEGVPGFDACYYLPSEKWMFAFLATNNAGGDGFFIPIDIVQQVPNFKNAAINANHDGCIIRSARGVLQEITRISPVSCLQIKRHLPITQEQLDRWQAGEMIQKVFPHLTAGEREFLMSGMTEEEFDLIAEEKEDAST